MLYFAGIVRALRSALIFKPIQSVTDSVCLSVCVCVLCVDAHVHTRERENVFHSFNQFSFRQTKSHSVAKDDLKFFILLAQHPQVPEYSVHHPDSH